MDKYIGKRLDGRYEIRELIGVGGMAYVYCAYDSIDEREVAVKILKDEYLTNEEFTRRFKNESKAIAILSHPNIVKVLDVSFGDKIQYIVMEYIDGISLKEYIEQQRVTWQEAVYFVQQILRALQHAHDKGIVHRDIKPQNIMLLADGTIKVTDFGIARFSRNDARTDHTNKAIGSVHYISPEQARGALTDEKSDIYSVGVMLYEMLTGTLPFEADNAVSVAIMQLQSQAKKPTEINPDIPDGLEEITMKAMQKNPEKRYQSAAEMLQDIQEFKQNPSIHFAYTYLTDENPTRYVDAITSIRGASYNTVPEEIVPIEEEEKTRFLFSKPFWFAIGASVILIALIVFGILAFNNGWIFGNNSKDEITVPNFVGKNYDDLTDADFKLFSDIEKEEEFSEYEKGQIIKQDPDAGKRVKKGQRVLIVTISKGPKPVTLPPISENMKEEDVNDLLKQAGFKPVRIEASSDTVEKGKVIKIECADTTPVDGSKVYVYVSTGKDEPKPVAVSDVVGNKKEDAIKQLQEEGFKVVEANIEEKNSEKDKGIVLEQSPSGGSELVPGSEIKLTVSSGYRDVQIVLPLPDVSCAVDLKVYVHGAYSAKYSGGLSGLLPSAVGEKTVVISEQEDDAFDVTFQISESGADDFGFYYRYEVDSKTGKATSKEHETFEEPVKPTEPPRPTEPEETDPEPIETDPVEPEPTEPINPDIDDPAMYE